MPTPMPPGAASLRAIAAQLTARKVETARGGEWNAAQVSNILKRAGVCRPDMARNHQDPPAPQGWAGRALL